MNELFVLAFQQALPLAGHDHDQLLAMDRRAYATLLLSPTLPASDLMRVIVRLLAVTTNAEDGLVTDTQKQFEDRVISRVLPTLPPSVVLNGFRALVQRKVNNKRTSTTVRSYLFGAPQRVQWAVRYRGRSLRLLRHVMGKHVCQNCVHFLERENALLPHQHRYLRRHIYRYADENVRGTLREFFLFIFGELKEAQEPLFQAYQRARVSLHHGRGLPFATLTGLAHTFSGRQSRRYLKQLACVDKVKRERGLPDEDDSDIVASLRRFYLDGGRDKALVDVVEQCLAQELARIPAGKNRLAVVTDLSSSMKGSGDRVYNGLAIAVAVRAMLEARFEATLVDVGGDKTLRFPGARGVTDLAGGLITALEAEPKHIILISDGYENHCEGDAAAILEAAHDFGVGGPVVHVIPVFTEREDLSDRARLPHTTQITETGERGLWGAWVRIMLEIDPSGLFELLTQTEAAVSGVVS